MKLNVIIAKTEHASSSFTKMLKEYAQFFKNGKEPFTGVRKTYSAKEGTIDEPTKRGFTNVVTTVTEKLSWLQEGSKDYINNLFNIEATNAGGFVKAELKVNGESFGTYSSLELLRLKSLLEKSELEEMYSLLPVRSDTEVWVNSTDPQHEGREIFQNTLLSGVNSSTDKESYILEDPNVPFLKDTSKYQPQVAIKTSIISLGDYTVQRYSGEYTHRQRAEILRRRSLLLVAVVEALKIANEQDIVTSQMTGAKLFNFLHYGNIVGNQQI